MQYNVVQYSTVQYSTVECRDIPDISHQLPFVPPPTPDSARVSPSLFCQFIVCMFVVPLNFFNASSMPLRELGSAVRG